jgi:hypothetical protein
MPRQLHPRRWRALAVLSLSLVIIGMDQDRQVTEQR